MLNYIWSALVILSLVFALVADVGDLRHDTFRNGQPVPVTLAFTGGYDPDARTLPVTVQTDSAALSAHYGRPLGVAAAYSGSLLQSGQTREVRFAKDATLPEPLATIRGMTSERDNDLRGAVRFTASRGDSVAAGEVTFARVRFVKMVAITRAGIDMAKTAVTLALGLIGVIALWLGMLRIADKAGIINGIVRLAQPVLGPLFPELPRDHPALGLIVLNLSANVLGLGNAATPMGIKAMEELQKLNPIKDTATNSMVMLLALNTASVQLVPPVLLVAIMGLQVNQLYFAILICTACSVVTAIVMAKLLGRLKTYRASDPMKGPATEDRAPS